MNGYATQIRLTTTVRADMLESVAGYTNQDMNKELVFAVATLDTGDPDSMRWLMTLLERRISELDAA